MYGDTPIWSITGRSTGFGREIAKAMERGGSSLHYFLNEKSFRCASRLQDLFIQRIFPPQMVCGIF